MDVIRITDLSVTCIIGTRDHERVNEQELIVSIDLETDLRPAGHSDDLNDTVNYSDLRYRVIQAAQEGQYQLIERLAEVMAAICLEDQRVYAATVTISKPAALDEAKSAGVRIRRAREP